METTAVKLYSTGYREAKTYLAAALFVGGANRPRPSRPPPAL